MSDERFPGVFVHPTALVDEGTCIGEGTKVWCFSHIQSGATIGMNCTVGQNVNIASGVTVGNNCKIQNNVSIYDGVRLAEGVFCGPSCVFTNDLTPRAPYPKGSAHYVPTAVHRGATIGANATVVCGHELGEWCMVGAGAVVADDVPAHALVLGVPARQVGWVCECGLRLDKDLSCSACGRHYRRAENGLVEE